jgi:hypothetical protein
MPFCADFSLGMSKYLWASLMIPSLLINPINSLISFQETTRAALHRSLIEESPVSFTILNDFTSLIRRRTCSSKSIRWWPYPESFQSSQLQAFSASFNPRLAVRWPNTHAVNEKKWHLFARTYKMARGSGQRVPTKSKNTPWVKYSSWHQAYCFTINLNNEDPITYNTNMEAGIRYRVSSWSLKLDLDWNWLLQERSPMAFRE